MKPRSFPYCIGILLISCLLWSCGTFHRTVGHRGDLPPGQAKKIYGHRSAKDFAPGQVKKYYGTQSARDFAPGHNK